MVTKVSQIPEIWRIQVDLPQNPLKYLNCYVISGGERPLIVDTGFNRPECWRALAGGLADLGVDLCDADLFLTHLHGDHSGLAKQLADRGCTVYMSQDDHDYLKDGEISLLPQNGLPWGETLSHLDHLCRRKKIFCREQDGQRFYYLNFSQ